MFLSQDFEDEKYFYLVMDWAAAFGPVMIVSLVPVQYKTFCTFDSMYVYILYNRDTYSNNIVIEL